MRRINILGKGLNGTDVNALSALLTEAGFSTNEIEVIGSIGAPELNCEDEIFVVLAGAENAELNKDMVAAQKGGRRTICIWPVNAQPDTELPPAILKYAYSVVPWNAAKLCAVAADDDTLCFEKPDGQPLTKPETERNICVDEEAQ